MYYWRRFFFKLRWHIYARALMCTKRRNHLLMILTVMRQRQSAGIWGVEPASDRQATRACQITLMWDKIIMSPQTNLAAANRNWSFGKSRVSGRWVEAGTAELASGHTNTATEMLTSFTPVSVWLPRVQPKFYAQENLGQARGDRGFNASGHWRVASSCCSVHMKCKNSNLLQNTKI